MQMLYVISVWLHLVAVTAWLGGMLFLALVVVPWLRKGDRAQAAAMLRDTGMRFRSVGWWCFAVLVLTGSFNLYMRGVRFGSFVSPAWLGSAFGHAMVMKLGLFVVVLILSAIHDFSIGPKATLAVQKNPNSSDAQALRKTASWMGRLNTLLALAIVFLAVTLVRGWPF